MKDLFSNFIDQIPQKNMQDDEKLLGNCIAIFKPKKYITEQIIESEDYHMFILSSPPPEIYINGKQHYLEQRCIFCLNPGDSVFCTNAPTTKPFKSILIKPEMINKIAKEMDMEGLKFLKFQNPLSSDILHAIDNLDNEIKIQYNSTLMLDCLETQIIILLLRQFKTNIKNDLFLLPNAESYIRLAIEYIQMFYSANLTIEDICDEIHVSPFHFIRTFKQKTGLSPYQYLINVRIQRSKELLYNGGYSVSEVAELCGFISLSHFSNTFKTITGQSPSSYKKGFY